jgi:hypothetical protein
MSGTAQEDGVTWHRTAALINVLATVQPGRAWKSATARPAPTPAPGRPDHQRPAGYVGEPVGFLAKPDDPLPFDHLEDVREMVRAGASSLVYARRYTGPDW